MRYCPFDASNRMPSILEDASRTLSLTHDDDALLRGMSS
jgi:hypothetical protein